MPIIKKCPEGRIDCFAINANGECICLTDTDFGNRECPFFKPVSEMDMTEYCSGLHDLAMGRPWGGYMPEEGKK